jgi:alginate O-acetyltransferase complex protein AlgI
MLVGGLWHGAGWTFVIWGGLHGLFLIVNHGWTRFRRSMPPLARIGESAGYAVVSLVVTQICVVVAWVFFRADSLSTAGRLLGAMGYLVPPLASPTLHVSYANFALIGALYLGCLVLPNVNELFRQNHIGLDTYQLPRRWSLLRAPWAMQMRWAVATATLFTVALVAILMAGDGSPFLYFQF